MGNVEIPVYLMEIMAMCRFYINSMGAGLAEHHIFNITISSVRDENLIISVHKEVGILDDNMNMARRIIMIRFI